MNGKNYLEKYGREALIAACEQQFDADFDDNQHLVVELIADDTAVCSYIADDMGNHVAYVDQYLELTDFDLGEPITKLDIRAYEDNAGGLYIVDYTNRVVAWGAEYSDKYDDGNDLVACITAGMIVCDWTNWADEDTYPILFGEIIEYIDNCDSTMLLAEYDGETITIYLDVCGHNAYDWLRPDHYGIDMDAKKHTMSPTAEKASGLLKMENPPTDEEVKKIINEEKEKKYNEMQITLHCPKCKRGVDIAVNKQTGKCSVDAITFLCPHCGYPGFLNYVEKVLISVFTGEQPS